MKIISKYKDYYDYFQGIFGIDNTKVYTRKEIFKHEFDIFDKAKKDPVIYDFFICGLKYRIYKFRNRFYHTAKEMMRLDNLLKSIESYGGLQFKHCGWSYKKTMKTYEKEYNHNNFQITSINKKKREPVLVYFDGGYKVSLLKSFKFHKIVDAKTIYIQIETFMGWLKDNPPLPDKQTNVGKIEGHGFDKITSFRPNMKK